MVSVDLVPPFYFWDFADIKYFCCFAYFTKFFDNDCRKLHLLFLHELILVILMILLLNYYNDEILIFSLGKRLL
jgi:hypothetical protein